MASEGQVFSLFSKLLLILFLDHLKLQRKKKLSLDKLGPVPRRI